MVLIPWPLDSPQNIIFVLTTPAASNIHIKVPYVTDGIF